MCERKDAGKIGKDIKVERMEEKVKLQEDGGKKVGDEGGEYSRLVFQLITTEGPGAAVRHIFFTNDFFYYKH